MESVKNAFESFKEFTWDIIGYFLPGSLVIIILSSILLEKYQLPSTLIEAEKGMFVTCFIILSYLCGYVVYGFGVAKDNFRGTKSYSKKIEAKMINRENYKIAKELIIQKLQSSNVTNDLSTATVRDVRNISMGFAPESDQKVYTFMFRSDISNHVSNISLVFGPIGLFSCLINLIGCKSLTEIVVFKTGPTYLMLYVVLLSCHFILRAARDRFYAIAIGLPFSIFISKELNK